MTAKDTFGLVVRTFGLAISLFGVYDVLAASYVALTPTAPHNAPASWAFVYGGILAAVGLYLLRGAPLLLRFAYPDKQAEPATNAKPRIPWNADC